MKTLNIDKGFTLIEIIVIILVLGILAAVAVTRMSGNNADVIVQRDITMLHLRYTQNKAMSTNKPWYISFSSNSYQLFEGGSTPAAKTLPGEDSTTATLSEGVTFSPSGATVSYNSWGQPATDTAAQTLQSGSRTLTFTSSEGTRTITIIENTGLLQ